MIKGRRFHGHVDKNSNGNIFGWIFDKKFPNRSVNFDLFYKEKYVGYYSCSYFRPDLKKLGLGNGFHGFKLYINEIELDELDLNEIQFKCNKHRVTLTVNTNGVIIEHPPRLLDRIFYYRSSFKNFRDKINKYKDTDNTGVHSKCLVNRLSISKVYKDSKFIRPLPSDFTRYMQILTSKTGKEFYCWYVYEYMYRLERGNIPATTEEILYIRSMVENEVSDVRSPKFSTIFRLMFPVHSKKLVELHPYYWWKVEGGRQLRLDNLCAPESSQEKLKGRVKFGFGESYPLSYFMLIFALKNIPVSIFSMMFPFGRRRIHTWLELYQNSNRHFEAFLLHPVRPLKFLEQEVERDQGKGTEQKIPLQLIGPFDKILGLGESSRRLAEAIKASNIECKITCYTDGIQSKSTGEKFSSIVSESSINIIHMNMEQVPEFFLSNGSLLESSYNILFPYWELDRVSTVHLLGLDLVDEVWAATDFIYEQMLGEIPVTKIGVYAEGVVNTSESNKNRRNNRSFTFLITFDALSWPQRKNAEAVVCAFQKAFDSGEDVALIVKTQNTHLVHANTQKKAWEKIQNLCSKDSRIRIINDTYSVSDQKKLINSVDCLVSLHRAEGLGIDILDSLSKGLPVVVTAYSGNMDICTSENSWLVDFCMIPVSKEDYVFVDPGHQWADPKQASAINALRSVFCEVEERIRKAERGIKDTQQFASMDVVGQRISGRLSQINKL